MKGKKWIIVALILAVAVTTLVFGSQSSIARRLIGLEPSESFQVPDHVVYDHLFRLVVSFKKQSESSNKSPEKAAFFKNYFETFAKLTDAEDQTLYSIAKEYLQETVWMDAQAKQIIVQTRKMYPNGVVPKDQPPPPALGDLQETRNGLAVQYYERLRDALGEGGFAKLDEFIRKDIAPSIQSIPLPVAGSKQPEK